MKIFTKITTVRMPSTMVLELESISELIQRHPSQIIRLAISNLIRTYHQNPNDFAGRYLN